MRKEGKIILVSILVLSILCLSLVSANWFTDLFKKKIITGNYLSEPPTVMNCPIGTPIITTCNCTTINASVPMYMLWSDSLTAHLYTPSLADKNTAASSGYTYVGIDFYVYPKQEAGTVPIYYLSHSIGANYYTISATDKDNVINVNHYTFIGIRGYAYATQVPGSVPLYKTSNAAVSNWYYTINATLRDQSITTYGYTDQGIAAYVLPGPVNIFSTGYCCPTGRSTTSCGGPTPATGLGAGLDNVAFINKSIFFMMGEYATPAYLDSWITGINQGLWPNRRNIIMDSYVSTFQTKYGIPAKTNTEFITFMYNKFLGRAPTSADMTSWLNAMSQGWTKQQVAQYIIVDDSQTVGAEFVNYFNSFNYQPQPGQSLNNPQIGSVPSQCTYGSSCGNILIYKNNAQTANLDIVVTHVYFDNSQRNFCFSGSNPGLSCNSTAPMSYIYNDFSLLNSGITTDSVSYPIRVSETPAKKILKIIINVSASNQSSRSGFATIEIPVAYPTTSECNYVGQTKCNGTLGYHDCSFDSSGLYFKWSLRKDCSAGYSCGSTQKCEFIGTVNCIDQGRFCASATPSNSIAESSLSCASGSCYRCNEGYHQFGETCANNNCTGTEPLASAGLIKGPSTLTAGEGIWTYSPLATTTSVCQWKCIDSYHQVNNNCTEGPGNCDTTVGCQNVPIANAVTNIKNCSYLGPSFISYSCYQCNSGYSWNGTSCITCVNNCTGAGERCVTGLLPNSHAIPEKSCCSENTCQACDNGYNWNGFACVPGAACDGCVNEVDNVCLKVGYRIEKNSQKLYCSGNQQFAVQKDIDAACANNHECLTNTCVDNKCVNLLGQVESQTSLIWEILCWLRHPIDSSARATCITTHPSS